MSSMVFARKIYFLENYRQLLESPELLKEVRQNIQDGDVYILRRVISEKLIQQWKEYFARIGGSSLPNYAPIERGAANSHRINIWDDRSYVGACFHQFNFYPWNQDIFQLFEKTKEIFYIKNLVSGNPREKFLGKDGDDGCVTRLGFQFYPSGIGGMHKHVDPKDHHQLCVPTLTMSKKSVDFETGGVFAEDAHGKKIYLDDVSEIGDVTLFNAQTPHGVEIIDEGREPDWLSFRGRWMMLFAVNKVASNTAIANAESIL